MNSPRLVKPQRVSGRTLSFRDAAVADAAFILSLRLDAQKSKHLSATSPDLQKQIDWLAAYADDGEQVYFIIEDSRGAPVGTVRLYDCLGDSFGWGSWILKDGLPPQAAIESMLMVYSYGRALGFARAHFEVRKGNEAVWRFHESFGAVRTGETELNYLYELPPEKLENFPPLYARFLPDGISF